MFAHYLEARWAGYEGNMLYCLWQGITLWDRTTRRKAMRSDHESTPRAHATGTGGASDTRLPGRWITAAHIVWAVLIICTLVLFFISIPVYFAQLQLSCSTTSCAPGQLSSSAAQALSKLGLSLKGYATLSLLLGIAWSLVWFVVGGVLAWRKFNDWMALLIALTFLMQGSESILSTVAGSSSAWQFPALLVGFLAYLLLSLVFVVFPNGRFVPHWSYWLVVLYIPVSVQFNFFPNITVPAWITLSGNLLFVGLVICLLVFQVYRYWRVSNLVERQQTKWIVFCFTLLFVLVVASALIPALNQPGSFSSLIFGANFSFPALLIPLSFGIAIQRYRLYDIDIIINRTLVYGSLTIVLALVYTGLVIGLQTLLSTITGGSNLAIVASTLVIASLFQPLRKRLQDLIDRRFYRRKYDAAKILAAFSTSSREEVDLTQLGERLVSVVEETMQPTHVWLWLRPLQSDRKQQVIDEPLAL
jgi:hypothetical protein